MDIYKYLNSRDVRKHLQDIKYEFTPNQALYVILDSRNSSIQERHEALKGLAETYPDYIIEKRRSDIKPQPLKQFAESYINLEKKALDKLFKKEDGCVYTSRFLYDDGFGSWSDPYSDFDRAFEEYYDEILPQDNKEFITQIRKTYIYSGEWIEVSVLPNKSITEMQFYLNTCWEGPESEEEKAVLLYKEWMWVDIPVPFRRGDVVYSVTNRRKRNKPRQDLMVVDHIQVWSVEDWKANGFVDNKKYPFNSANFEFIQERLDSHKEIGDESDMCLYGAIVFEYGIISYDHVFPYLDFEYYRGDYKGEAIIKLLSNYYKGEIDEELLLNAYFILRSELAADKDLTVGLYTEEGAILAGLKESNEEKKDNYEGITKS